MNAFETQRIYLDEIKELMDSVRILQQVKKKE